jgi:hypothetical protein
MAKSIWSGRQEIVILKFSLLEHIRIDPSSLSSKRLPVYSVPPKARTDRSKQWSEGNDVEKGLLRSI